MTTKRCNGPAHPEPVMLPLDERFWYFHGSGKQRGQPLARCRLCTNWTKLKQKNGEHGLILVDGVHRFAEELVLRCGGYRQAGRQHGIRSETLRGIVLREQDRIQKETGRRIIVALSEQRKLDRRNGGTSPSFLAARKTHALVEARMEKGERW